MSYAFWIEDCNWRYSRNCVLLMPKFWTKCVNETKVLSWKMCCSCVIPFSAHVWKCGDFLFISRSGLFHMGVNLDGVRVELVILWNFHQAVRVEDIVKSLKQGYFLMDLLRKGRSEIEMVSHIVCSISSQVVSDCWGWVHLSIYCSWIANA